MGYYTTHSYTKEILPEPTSTLRSSGGVFFVHMSRLESKDKNQKTKQGLYCWFTLVFRAVNVKAVNLNPPHFIHSFIHLPNA